MAKAPAIGISFGVTTASVAVYRYGEVEMIPIDNGNFTMPCMVAFKPDSSCLVGDAAKDFMGDDELNYHNTVYDIGRMLGRQYKNVQDLVKIWPFHVINDSGKIKVKVPNNINTFTPDDLCEQIFRKLRESAQTYIGQKALQDAVICVPAYYTHLQWHSIVNAGRKAGFNILKLINQNIAVQRFYNLNSKPVQHIAIVKVGGSTTVVSLIDNTKGNYREKMQMYMSLGGNKFDDNMVQFCIDDFQKNFGFDLRESNQAIVRLRSACEKVKCCLSKSISDYVLIDNLYECINYSAVITQRKFEELCSSNFHTISKVIQDSLKAENFDASSEGSKAFIIGGSAKHPKLRTLLEDALNCEFPKDLDPQLIEVYGAAMEALHLRGGIFCSVDAHRTLSTISIKTQDRELEILIPRGQELPVTRTWPSSGYLRDVDSFILVEGGEENVVFTKQLSGFSRVTIRVDKYGLLDVTLE